MGERFAGRTCVRRDSSEGGGAFARRARGGVAQTPQLSPVRPAAARCCVSDVPDAAKEPCRFGIHGSAGGAFASRMSDSVHSFF